MQTKLTQRKIDDYRRRSWPHGDLQSLEETAAFVERAGLVLIFGSQAVPLPKLYDCANESANWWAWKDLLQAKKLAYSARVVRHKATLVSMRLLAPCLSLYLHGGGYLMFEEEYYWGKLSELANRVAKHLEEHGPTPVDQLRQATVPSGKENTRRFHAALLELQTKYKIVSVGLVEKGWGVRVLGLFVDWVPPRIEQAAERMPKEKALELVIEQATQTAGAVSPILLQRMFGWEREDVARALQSLKKSGKVAAARLRDKNAELIVSPSLAETLDL